MRSFPKLKNDFILDDPEYRASKAWLEEANAQTILHPLEDAELERQRQQMKKMVEEYETNWRDRR